jgi:hypothetical protein
MSEQAKKENLLVKSESLPVVIDHDGFDDTDIDDRLIQGTIIRCVDGVWSARDETVLSRGTRLVVLNTAEALQRWENQRPVETIVKQPGQPLPDADELNAKIPKKRWEKGLDGQLRAPWVKQHIAYLLDPKDAAVFTFVNSTVGARIAVERLKDRVKMMRALRGERVVPIVELGSKPMPTGFGTKQRPDFIVHEWRNLGGPQAVSVLAAQQERPTIRQIGQPVRQVSVKEELDDEIEF